ncbi:hypothetical protein MNBD_GAMMA05-177 [hydrothermal vent metagenome]|uniref:Uncharacterized protein n=1 Tax=hydrothermal vent metagenome TaxID=652676 RepID=A0A3B0WLV7_9ZZZZ
MSKKIDPRFPPQQFKASSYSPVIILSHLSEEDKESLWEHLKKYYPQKARGLVSSMSDPFVEIIMDKEKGLGALLAIELEYAPDPLKKHQHIL